MSKVTIWDSGERGKFPEQLARELLEKYGHPCANAVKELHGTFLSLSMMECADILYAVHDEMREEALLEENARLRRLLEGVGRLLFSLDVDYCAGCARDDINHPCPVYTIAGGECLYKTDMRELGVEVGE